MKSIYKLVLSLILAVLFTITSVGCTSTPVKSIESENSIGNSTDNSKGTVENGQPVYPIKTDVTLTFWVKLNANSAQFASSYADLPNGQEMEKETGVKIKFIHPAQAQWTDSFNIMVASGDFPDMVQYDWSTLYPGGPTKAINDKVIIPLNDVIGKYSPNLQNKLNSDEQIDKLVKTDDGTYYVYPYIAQSASLFNFGPMMRKDWLTDLNMQPPETMDEWYTVLKAFKEKKNAESPLSFLWHNDVNEPYLYNAFLGAYKVAYDFYVEDNGKIAYGPLNPGYKDFLATFSKWYKEELIDQDFAVNTDPKALKSNFLGGKAGAVVYLIGGGMKVYLDEMKTVDPKFDIVGLKFPVLEKGEKPFLGQADTPYYPWNSVAITTNCKNVDIAATWLDFNYTEQGNLLNNFGIEGKTYEMVNGEPQYTDFVLNPPQDLNLSKVLAQYTKGSYFGPSVGDNRLTQYLLLPYPQQKEAVDKWGDSDAYKHTVPSALVPTADEIKELSVILSQLNTCNSEMFIKFVMGVEPLASYDKFVEQLKTLGVERAIQLKQQAFDRYNAR